MMHELGMFDRKGALNTEGFLGSGADWLERYKPFIEDGKTIVASPHKCTALRRTTSCSNCASGVSPG